MVRFSVIYRAKMFPFFLFLTLFVLITILTFDMELKSINYYYNHRYGDISCHYQHIEDGIKDTTTDIYFNPKDNESIFFHETSCKTVNGNVVLTPRQACAVESAALMNPELKVYLLFSSPIVLGRGGHLDNILIKHLLSYENVQISRLAILRYVADTPIHAWFMRGPFQKSSFRTVHTSDVLRYLSLWRYGGIYLDLDVIVLKNLKELNTNYAGRESPRNIANGIMSISHDKIGRRFADATLSDIRSNFRGDLWGHNGPGVITRVLRHTCTVHNVSAMTTDRCGGFTVYPPSTFYPIGFESWYWYFQPDKLKKVLYLIKDSYAVHVWNKVSGDRPTQSNVTSAYTYLAKKYCPKVYEETKEHF